MAEEVQQPKEEADRWLSTLTDNKDKEFVQRILFPDRNPAPIMEGEFAQSHRMAAEVDEEGNWYAFPTIINDNGTLHQFQSNQEAMNFARRTGEFIEFGSDAEAAQDFAINYKTQEFLDFYRKPHKGE